MLTMLTIITAVKQNYNIMFQNQILQQQAALTKFVLALPLLLHLIVTQVVSSGCVHS